MLLAGVKVVDTSLIRDAIDLARSFSEPYLFNHVMRSWLFGVLIAETSTATPDPEILAVSVILHDLGLTDRYAGEHRFEVDGANAARSFLKERGIPADQIQLVWDAIALHTTPSLALHKEPEVAAACAGIAVDVVAMGLDQIRPDEIRAILTEFPRLAFKRQFLDCLCSVVRRKPTTTYDNVLRDVGMRYVEGYIAPSTTELLANAPFGE
jgi:hypothetical protein